MSNNSINKIMTARTKEYLENQDNFEVCDFGSCQYSTADVMFDYVTDAIKILGYEGFCKYYGITHGKVLPETELIPKLQELIDEHYADDPEWKQEAFEGLEVTEVDSIARYFEITKGTAWDLWSAWIPPVVFLEGFEMGSTIADQNRGVGPILNIMAQSENKEMGVALALMAYHYKLDKATFAGFDT